MSNEEKVLKYFSDELSTEEKRNFEKEIEASEELQKEFYKMEKSLSGLKEDADVKTAGTYFVNLVPNVRKRMEKKKKFFTVPKLVTAVPVIVILFVLSISFNDTNKNFTFSLDEHSEALNEIVKEASIEQLSEFVDVNTNYESNNFNVLSDNLNIDNENILVVGENVLQNFDEYELVNNLSEDELNEIYNKLLNAKIL